MDYHRSGTCLFSNINIVVCLIVDEFGKGGRQSGMERTRNTDVAQGVNALVEPILIGMATLVDAPLGPCQGHRLVVGQNITCCGCCSSTRRNGLDGLQSICGVAAHDGDEMNQNDERGLHGERLMGELVGLVPMMTDCDVSKRRKEEELAVMSLPTEEELTSKQLCFLFNSIRFYLVRRTVDKSFGNGQRRARRREFDVRIPPKLSHLRLTSSIELDLLEAMAVAMRIVVGLTLKLGDVTAIDANN
jgi:hypothetical protein